MGSNLTKPQRTSLVSRILKRFSAWFWIAGCCAPRVEGYTAHLELKPGAVPVCQQPFPLSVYDQLRLEYHEDLEDHEGKADWLDPGVVSPWASPSFVVDQAGKGLLGRPVHDYRVVNSNTLDHGYKDMNPGSLHSRNREAFRTSIQTTRLKPKRKKS